MTVDITAIINAAIALIAAVISAFVIPWIKSKTTAQQRGFNCLGENRGCGG